MIITAGDFLAGGGGVTEALTRINNVKVEFVLNHSKANGGKAKKIGSYMLGWELIRYLEHMHPLVIGIENVPEFKKWAPLIIKKDKKNSTKSYSALSFDKEGNYKFIPDPKHIGEIFEKWKETIKSLGYDYHENINNAADFGLSTRRVRYFAFFTKEELNMSVNWPKQTHNRYGSDGLKKWNPCKKYINLNDEGNSIFGRKYNPDVAKGKRKPLCDNTLIRIAGGIKQYAPEFEQFILQYYGNGLNSNSLDSPLNSVTTKDRHVLISLEKKQFIQDHCLTDNYNLLEEPIRPQLTRQTKQFISADFFVQNYSGQHSSGIDDPLPTITTIDHNSKVKFISYQNNSNGKPHYNNNSIERPLNAISTERKQQFISHHWGRGSGINQLPNDQLIAITKEKIQFISLYFSSGNQKTQNQSIDSPLNAITTGANKQALITAINNGDFDFDVKMRFLEPEELSRISSFPPQYFTHPLLKLTKKEQTKLIGNAVPPDWAEIIIKPVIQELQEKLNRVKRLKRVS